MSFTPPFFILFKVQSSMFKVQSSMFKVQCSMFNVQCCSLTMATQMTQIERIHADFFFYIIRCFRPGRIHTSWFKKSLKLKPGFWSISVASDNHTGTCFLYCSTNVPIRKNRDGVKEHVQIQYLMLSRANARLSVSTKGNRASPGSALNCSVVFME